MSYVVTWFAVTDSDPGRSAFFATLSEALAYAEGLPPVAVVNVEGLPD